MNPKRQLPKKDTVYIAHCKDYDIKQIEKIIAKGFKELGITIKPKSKVLLKPNLLLAADPAKMITTHPVFFEAICRFLTKKKVKTIVGESSGVSTQRGTLHAFRKTGLSEIAEQYNVSFVSFDERPRLFLENTNNTRLPKFPVADILTDVDYIINLPKLKTHTLVTYTGAVKNFYGCIPGGLKQRYHAQFPRADTFSELLVDIYQTLPKTITVMDAIIGMEGNGPSAGQPKPAEHILIAENAPALDEVACSLIGFQPQDVPTQTVAKKRNLFTGPRVIGDYTSIHTLPHYPFKKPEKSTPGFLNRLFFGTQLKRPKVMREKCTRCGVCVTHCPVNAITMHPYPTIDYSTCINCYCCHELCSYHAIELKETILNHGLKRLIGIGRKILKR